MGTLLKKLWQDDNFFLRFAAVLLSIGGNALMAGAVPNAGPWGTVAGAAANSLAVGIATGKWEFGKQ